MATAIKTRTLELLKEYRFAENPHKQLLENDIIVLNINFALYKARRFRHRSVEFDDVVSGAMIGLMNAVRTYDFETSQFSTYAGHVIENEIRQVYRKANRKKHTALNPLSLDRITATGTPLLELIVDNTNFESAYIDEQLFQDLLSTCQTILDDIELTAFNNSLLPLDLRIPQQVLATQLSRSQTTISRAEKRAAQKIRDHLNTQEWGLELLR